MILHREDAKDAKNKMSFIARRPLRICGERLYFKIYLQY